MVQPTQPVAEYEDVTISDGTSISSAVNLKGRVLVGVYIPASWTTASMTFTVSDTESGNYVDLYSTAGSEFSLSADSSRYMAVDWLNTMGVNFLKVRSGTSAAAVNQSGDITIKLALGRPS